MHSAGTGRRQVNDRWTRLHGPGNNSYLRHDAESGGFTVVADTVEKGADAIRETLS